MVETVNDRVFHPIDTAALRLAHLAASVADRVERRLGTPAVMGSILAIALVVLIVGAR
jgi:hypothetical protein